eukprot:Awhi_evm2s4528
MHQWIAHSSRLLGSGEFGQVYEGEFRNDPNSVSVKVAIKELKEDASVEPDEFFKEVTVMNTLRHPKLIKLYGLVIESKPYWMINEFMSKGDLLEVLRKEGDTFDL